ncbi:Gfo/Idh/MocA family protein [Proteiniphilum sp. UBA5384]|uniref:Gfo/Idh/MocA family protein n=1 Tax=Proteiniphilum sp. UBA5384 TaxID=1947279 RepID=UPI0025CD71BA|nr:Gfo/Idh/MocA family oxidoreductase [Proteiniphilum sp. UBA5384]
MEKQDNDTGKIQPEYISRRNILKAFAGIPVVGLLGFGLFERNNYDRNKRKQIAQELGLDKIEFSVSDYGNGQIQDIIRVGIIGFGRRAEQLASGLGFMHPEEIKKRKNNNTFNHLLEQENLHVAITGICDVFDMHAERGLIIANNSILEGTLDFPAKRYHTYQEMLADKDIDAIIISTPDHHHARIAIDATKAGKHVYLEKSVAHTEEELNELYHAVKNSHITFQLGHQITQSAVFKQAKKIIDKNVLGKITLIETTSNRNSAEGAWIRHLDSKGNFKPGDEKTIDWKQWLGNTPYVPFSIDRFYNWTKWFAYDTGMIGQLFTHEYDAVNQLLRIGIPKSVASSGGIYYWKDNREMPDSLHCVFEYPDKELTLMYSGNLASSRSRGRVFMGHDASMELGNNIKITVDKNSTQYQKGIVSGLIDTGSPILSFNPNAGQIDAVTSASEKYYADRGLTNTIINGQQVDVTHLHLREWLNCIRNGKTPSANIEVAYEEGITCLMAHRSYLEKRQVFWDDENKKIV